MDALFDWRKNFCHAVRTSDLVHTIKYVNGQIQESFLSTTLRNAKYQRIADILYDEIGNGTYPVGAALPSETSLAESFGVSRHTVRAALRHLQHHGLIASQQGVGSVVQTTRSKSRYTQSFDSIADLQQYAADTYFEVISKATFVVDEARAIWLGCKPRERWWHVRTTRHTKVDGTRFAFVEIYIPYGFARALDEIEKVKVPVIFQIERKFGQTVTDIRQDISAVAVTADEAEVLGITPGSPALQIVRHHFGKDNMILEVSRAIFLPESFS